MLVSQIVDQDVTKDSSSASDIISVLVLENDADDLYLLRKYLTEDNRKRYRLESTDILKAGLEILLQRQFDMILLDLGLSDSQGIDTLKILVSHPNQLPIIVLTGADDHNLGEVAIKEGAADYIPKAELTTSLLSRSISYAIERHRLIRQLQEQAKTDALTQLPNRAAVFERLESLIYDSDRRSLTFGIGMIDMDDFKDINDNLGHRAGDDLLRQIATRLQKGLRRSDMAARLGGDEFIIIITHFNSEKDFLDVLEKKQAALGQPIALFANGAIHNVNPGVSIGACEWFSPMTAQQLLSAADKAMYASKRKGKNCMSTAETSHAPATTKREL